MKTLRLLNKRYFSIILVLFIGFNVFAEEQPVDIWNIDKKEIENNSSISTSNNENNLKTNRNLHLIFMRCRLRKKIIQLS